MTIKLISLNVWEGGKLLPSIIDFLRREAADILLLQEVFDGNNPSLPENYRTMTVLRKALEYKYDDFAFAYKEDGLYGEIPQGNAIFSKFPLQAVRLSALNGDLGGSCRDVPENYPLLPRVVQAARVDASAATFHIANMHGVWDLDGDNPSEQRQHMVDRLLEMIDDKAPVILAGDSNAKPTNPAMKRIENRLLNVFQPDLSTTFNMRRKDDPGYATAAVDLMYASREVKVVSAVCPDVDISDHLPLVAVLNIT